MLAQLGVGQQGGTDVANETDIAGTENMVSSDKFLSAEYAHYLIFGSAIVSILYSAYCYYVVKSLEMTSDKVKVHKMTE